VLGETADILALAFSEAQVTLRNNTNMHELESSVSHIRSNLHSANDGLDMARGDVNTLLTEITSMDDEIAGGEAALDKMEKVLHVAVANGNNDKFLMATIGSIKAAVYGAVGCAVGMIAGPGGCMALASLAGGSSGWGVVGDLSEIERDRKAMHLMDQLEKTPGERKQFLLILKTKYEESRYAIAHVQGDLKGMDGVVLERLNNTRSVLDAFTLNLLILRCGHMKQQTEEFKQQHIYEAEQAQINHAA
jgi:hypothetical protein